MPSGAARHTCYILTSFSKKSNFAGQFHGETHKNKSIWHLDLLTSSSLIHSLKMWNVIQVCKNNFIDAKSKVKIMTTAYYRCTNVKMVVTINSDDSDENESQPQLATRWLWSFAFPCFESILLSFAWNPFESIIIILLAFVLKQFSLPFVLNS